MVSDNKIRVRLSPADLDFLKESLKHVLYVVGK
jgi:hypothetical protein